MVYAKIALAARVDASLMNSMNKDIAIDSNLGIKWKEEII